MKISTFLFFILLYTSFSFGENFSTTSIKPELERYSSIEQWENPNNWSPNIVPSEQTMIVVKKNSFIIDFNLDLEKKVVGSIDVSHGAEFMVTNRGSIFIINTLYINPNSSLIVEGALKVQKATIHSTDAEFTIDRIGSIDAHEIFLKVDNYTAVLDGHISSTYLHVHFFDKKGQLEIGDDAEIHIQSDFIIKDKYEDNIVGDISKITTYGCSGNAMICDAVTAYHLKLPTMLDYFDIEIEKDISYLYWETGTERDASHFIIEKSNDGKNYTKIGKVMAKGKSSTESSYELKDEKFEKSKDNYYRLILVLQDGEEYVWGRHLLANELDREEFGIEKVYPNPTNYYLKIDFHAEANATLDIKLHHTENEAIWDIKPKIEGNKAIFDVHHYPAGNYILKVKMNDLLVYSGTVIIHATNSKGNIKNSQAILVEEEK